jgi:D-beta-D-heptose 7-phosphate kinase/D-beta-D-heptose 1-phosphate adenosyltransferase
MEQLKRRLLINTIRRFKPVTMMVIGDIMLDRYTWGEVNRISPEAPIPVLKVSKEETRLGGAASTIANVKALNCQVLPIGLTGNDIAGKEINHIFEEQGISTKAILKEDNFQTIVKNRLLTHEQQLLRVDHETNFSLTPELENKLIQTILENMPEVDGVILSDYKKGILTPEVLKQTIAKAKELNLPIVCDPGNGVDFNLYSGVTTIKPNRSETGKATGLPMDNFNSILQAAELLKKQCDADFLSISLDKDGILLFRNADDYHLYNTEAMEVFDVTGAGDMVISIIGVLLAAGESPEIAIQMANVAAGLEISHVGVVPLSWEDISHQLAEHSLIEKITTLDKLKQHYAKFPEKSIVFTNGYFDNLSAGHLKFLLEMDRFQGEKIVAINSDASILKAKGKAPLLSEVDRARLLASLESVTWVLVFDDENASDLIETLAPTILVKGESFKDQIIPENNAIEKAGTRIEYLEHFQW